MTKKFDLTVENWGPKPEPWKAGESLEITGLEWDGHDPDSPPDIIYLQGQDGVAVIKRGRYAAPGDKYQYHRATVATLLKDGKTLIPGT